MVMVDQNALEIWLYRLLATVLIALWIFASLLPINGAAAGLPWPDIAYCLMIAWILRRPEFMPFPLIVVLGLTMDFLFFKVPGAWTLILLLSTEILRKSSETEGNSGVIYEGGAVLATLVGAFLGHRALLAIFGVQQPPLGGTLLELVFTLLAYPLVVLISVYILQIRRPDLAESLSFKIRS